MGEPMGESTGEFKYEPVGRENGKDVWKCRDQDSLPM